MKKVFIVTGSTGFLGNTIVTQVHSHSRPPNFFLNYIINKKLNQNLKQLNYRELRK